MLFTLNLIRLQDPIFIKVTTITMQEGEYPQPHAIYVFRPIRGTMIETLNSHRNGEALNYHPFRFDDDR